MQLSLCTQDSGSHGVRRLRKDKHGGTVPASYPLASLGRPRIRRHCRRTRIVALILVQRMFRAPTRDFRDTEVWIMLAKEVRPPAAFAQRMIGAALAESYRYCAIWAGCISGSLWMGYILLALI